MENRAVKKKILAEKGKYTHIVIPNILKLYHLSLNQQF